MWERTVIVCVPNSLCNGSCYYWSWHDIAPNFHYILKASSGGMLENALCSKLYVFETGPVPSNFHIPMLLTIPYLCGMHQRSSNISWHVHGLHTIISSVAIHTIVFCFCWLTYFSCLDSWLKLGQCFHLLGVVTRTVPGCSYIVQA